MTSCCFGQQVFDNNLPYPLQYVDLHIKLLHKKFCVKSSLRTILSVKLCPEKILSKKVLHRENSLPDHFTQENYVQTLSCYIDRWDIPSSELQRCSWLSERWQHISGLDTSPLTSRLCSQLQELQELPTSPLRMWSSSKKHQCLLTWAPGPRVEPVSRAYEADALPLSYPHILLSTQCPDTILYKVWFCTLCTSVQRMVLTLCTSVKGHSV